MSMRMDSECDDSYQSVPEYALQDLVEHTHKEAVQESKQPPTQATTHPSNRRAACAHSVTLALI